MLSRCFAALIRMPVLGVPPSPPSFRLGLKRWDVWGRLALALAALCPMRRHGANGKEGLAMSRLVLALLVALALVLLLASDVR